MNQKIKVVFLLIFFHILLIPANAVLPPSYYKRNIEASNIKAIATIIHVKTLSIGKYSSFKKVTFKLEYVFIKKRSKIMNNETPQIFTGLCSSVDTKEQNKNIMAGGTIYFYPHVGARVFVTVSEDGGSITTLTTMTPELDKAIRETPERLEFGMSRVYIKSVKLYPKEFDYEKSN